MYNTIPTPQQQSAMIDAIVSSVHRLNVDYKTFDFADGKFPMLLMDMYADCKKLFDKTSADYLNETLMTMFERSAFDRGADGLVRLQGKHEDLADTPQYITVSYDFINELFDTYKDVSLFLTRMNALYNKISSKTLP